MGRQRKQSRDSRKFGGAPPRGEAQSVEKQSRDSRKIDKRAGHAAGEHVGRSNQEIVESRCQEL